MTRREKGAAMAFGFAMAYTWTGDSRGLRLGGVIVPVCRGPVLLDVLPNARVEAVGPGAVRAVVVIGLVDPDATNETTV